MKLKICGMKHNTEEVAALKPDYLGYIFWKPSERYFHQAMPETAENIRRVGVFVDAPREEIVMQLLEHQLDALQLHGEETAAFCAELKDLINQFPGRHPEMIKAFAIDEDFDFDLLEPYQSSCDYFLFDTRGELPGGTGRQFNWQLLKNYTLTTPYFLSGGIGPEDDAAIKDFFSSPMALHCYAIDINSRFEKKPGLKNIRALQSFMEKLGLNTKSK